MNANAILPEKLEWRNSENAQLYFRILGKSHYLRWFI